MSFTSIWERLLPLGLDPRTGGYRRYSWTEPDMACRAWFASTASGLGLRTDCDRNGNLWAWWGRPGTEAAVVTGSHLDSVPDGGAYDGPLGIVSAFAAIAELRARGFRPAKPIAVAAFTEEEGARFGVACLGSRLLTGAIGPEAARALRDRDGVSLAEAMRAAGREPGLIGPDDDLLDGIAAYVELHIEQGSALNATGAPIGIAAGIWPHGRWRLDFTGRADHAGTTRLGDRRDPMLPYAATALTARQAAADCGGLATFGKVMAEPGAANAICSAVHAWLDARAPDEASLDSLTGRIGEAAREASGQHGVGVRVSRESFTPAVSFDPALRDRMAAVLTGVTPGDAPRTPAGTSPGDTVPPGDTPGPDGRAPAGTPVPVLATGAGHDAGVLAGRVPAGMLFVRNPTGVSHSPAERAEPGDCEAGVAALTAVLADLAAG